MSNVVIPGGIFNWDCAGKIMKFVIQRVTEAKVEVGGNITGQIHNGFMVLIGICQSDTKEVADKLIKKMIGLRIFEDSEGKTNLSMESVGGSLLLVSQFTLYADCKKGYRPSFVNAGSPDHANELYEYIVAECRKQMTDLENKRVAAGFSAEAMKVETGIFGADMKVTLVNDGPFTIILDSRDL